MELTDADRQRFYDKLSTLIGAAQDATDAAKAELAATKDISHHTAMTATNTVGEVTGFTRAFEVVGLAVPGDLSGRIATLAEDWHGVEIRRKK